MFSFIVNLIDLSSDVKITFELSSGEAGGWELICDLISAQPPPEQRNKTLVIANFLATTLQPFKFCCSTHKESC